MDTILSASITLAPLALGLAAWALAAAGLFCRKTGYIVASWILCGCSLWFPLQAIHRWVENGDTAAILDCTGAYFLCATVLLAVNLLLTGIGLIRRRIQLPF